MNISQVKALLSESELSPEQLGQRVQMSGMTIRRLLKRPDEEVVPEAYRPLMRQGVYALIIEGKLKPHSPIAKQVVSDTPSQSFEAAIHALGFRKDVMKLAGSYPDQMLIGLSEIGASPERQNEVKHSTRKFSRFLRMGAEWAQRVTALRKVIGSGTLSPLEKLAAYGALFYLITVFDLIPDTIPMFGILDDFAILGIVAAYYVRKFPHLFDVNAGP
jgi:uncharacterized membrane protein YkvA (DUF1232 family)